MKFYIGVTDIDWYQFLKDHPSEDLNFWQPGGTHSFGILKPGEPFLFKLKSPVNKVAGLAFFVQQSRMPLSMAWEVFGTQNGRASYGEFKQIILSKRREPFTVNPQIGCIVLTNPIFFDEKDWFSPPSDWKPAIVQGKSYDMSQGQGASYWKSIENHLQYLLGNIPPTFPINQLILSGSTDSRYAESILCKVRLGQRSFRMMVSQSYQNKCVISGEKTGPVLEAAHIKPYAEEGPHTISNGLLLRSDIHKLFDDGYITIDKDYKVVVSKKIKEDFGNGREYYKYDNSSLIDKLPHDKSNWPDLNFIDWHNNKFLG